MAKNTTEQSILTELETLAKNLREISTTIATDQKFNAASKGSGGGMSDIVGGSQPTSTGWGGRTKQEFMSGMPQYMGLGQVAQSLSYVGGSIASSMGAYDPLESVWKRKSSRTQQRYGAGGAAIGSVVGGAIGSLIPGGGGISAGMMVGSSIGQSFGSAIGEDKYRQQTTDAGRVRTSVEDLVELESRGVSIPQELWDKRLAMAGQRAYRYGQAAKKYSGLSGAAAGALSNPRSGGVTSNEIREYANSPDASNENIDIYRHIYRQMIEELKNNSTNLNRLTHEIHLNVAKGIGT